MRFIGTFPFFLELKMSVNLFEKATREAWRFPSVKGQLSVEQLWGLPLKDSKTNFDLDTVAKTTNADVKAESEESFVAPVKTDQTPRQKLDLVKSIITTKLAEQAAAVDTKAKAEQRAKIMEALAKKQDAKLSDASEAELLEQLKNLG